MLLLMHKKPELFINGFAVWVGGKGFNGIRCNNFCVPASIYSKVFLNPMSACMSADA